ncbi:MAG: CoA-binding protein, partial [Deltaproteobacteria bacterium]|nr:CoA-binding protein [Deltaproteobacteria bacterium]
NPLAEEILNRKCYPDLKAVEETIDILEVFRPFEEAAGVVREAVERRRERGDIAVIWLQEGIMNDEAQRLAEEAGITFVQDRCMYKEYKRFSQ